MTTKCAIAAGRLLGGHRFSLNGKRVSREQFFEVARGDPFVRKLLVRVAIRETFGLGLDECLALSGE